MFGSNLIDVKESGFYFCYNLTQIDLYNVVSFGKESFCATGLLKIQNKNAKVLLNSFKHNDSLLEVDFESLERIEKDDSKNNINEFYYSNNISFVRMPNLSIDFWK